MRRERDSLGEKAVPTDALYGIFTQRARETFDLSGFGPHPQFLRAIALIKKAAARTNRRLGLLPRRVASAIEWAADRVIRALDVRGEAEPPMGQAPRLRGVADVRGEAEPSIASPAEPSGAGSHAPRRLGAVDARAAGRAGGRLRDATIGTQSMPIGARDEVAEAFVLDAFQAGAGTPTHMNVNEVVANLANERLGGHRGRYAPVHPNDHVNLGQSSNDVTPTAIRLAALALTGPLVRELAALEREFRRLAAAHQTTLKPGRTHLQDAVPITYGQVFTGYAESVRGAAAALTAVVRELEEIGLGGTAVGTGITAHPRFGRLIAAELSRLSGFRLRPARSRITTTWSLRPLVAVSAGLRGVAIDCAKICFDVRLLASGPHTGFAELILPEVEPGSSIMPGKVNPSVPEAAQMACLQVLGNDTAIAAAATAGELELNVMTPLVAFDLTWSFELLTRALRLLRTRCIAGLRVDRRRTADLVGSSLIEATALSPYLGYAATARLVKEALASRRPLRDVVEARGLIGRDVMRRLLAPAALTSPQRLDQRLKRRIQRARAYRAVVSGGRGVQ